jgi:hypothetical protein
MSIAYQQNRPLAVCVAPAGNKEQTKLASGLATILVCELCVYEMQPNNDENLAKLGTADWAVRPPKRGGL